MIEEQELAEVLPFSFWMNQEHVIYAAGRALSRRHPRIVGQHAGALYELPARWASRDEAWPVESLLGRTVNLIDRKDGLRLMGQFARFGERLAFFASPQVATLEELKKFGLHIDEFAAHDGIMDRLMTVRSLDLSRGAEISRARELEKQERRFRNIVENASGVILNIEKDGEIAYANPTAKALFPRGTGAYQLGDYLTRESRDALETGLQNISAGAEKLDIDLESEVRPGTAAIYLEGQLLRNTSEGDSVTSGFFRNVTKEHLAARNLEKSQEQLREAQKMETVGRLAGGIAHDFNNLLGVIRAAAESIQETETTTPFDEDLELVLSSCEKGAFLSRQLLLFSRGTEATHSPTSTDLVEIAEKTALLITRVLSSDVAVRVETPVGESVPVNLDPVQFEQILINLALNAGHAMPEGGIFVLRVETQDGLAVVTAQDTGIGMSRAVANVAFEPFFTTRSRDSGTGLGLSVVYGIVKAARGTIRIDSELGRGTDVIMEFPLTAEKPSESSAVTQSTQRINFEDNPQVVVVEDQDELRRLIVRMLERWGCDVREFSGLESARAFASELTQTRLLVTDAQLGDGNGVDLAQEWMANGTCASVLVITGYTERDIAAGTAGIEGCEVLTKPFTMVSFNQAVERGLRRTQPQTAASD
ncbi:MAG: ATP-binding protein [Myxococcota bacterium]|nr:ATP-binding protein [Myxococcota bacterium]